MLRFRVTFLIVSAFLSKVLCNSCKEVYELSITCNSFEDLFKYPDPENVESVSVKSKDVFICDEPMFEKFTSVSHLSLQNARVLHVSSDCFQGMNAVRAIELNQNDLTSIEMDAFRTSDEMELRAIFLNNNHIVKIDFGDIVLPEVTQFEAYFNRIKYVKVSSENLPKVSNMYFGNNQISRFSIESQTMGKLDLSENRIKAFKGSDLILPNLYLIYLNDNQLTTVTPDMFQNMPSLQTIYLAHNLLTTVSFPNLPMASGVDLRYNRIKTMENVNLSTFGQDYSLQFDSNKVFQMETQTPFEKLISFTCHSCFIHIVEPFFFANTYKNIEYLTLASNFLTTANIFKSSSEDLKLKSIQLSFNKIKRIGRKDFERVSQLNTLRLDHNDITVIASGAFDKLPKLDTIDLSDNLLVQLSANLFEKNALQVLSITGNNMPFFKVPGWTEMPGVPPIIQPVNSKLNKLNSLHIWSNPLQCGCIDLLRSWAKKNKIFLGFDDEKVRNGLKPACIVNDDGCNTDVGKDYIKDYWHLFNDKRVKDIFDEDEEE